MTINRFGTILSSDCSEEELSEQFYYYLCKYTDKKNNKHLDALKKIIRHLNFNPNGILKERLLTPLTIAVAFGCNDIVNELLALPSTNIHAEDHLGYPPVYYAVATQNVAILQTLIDSPKFDKSKLKQKYDKRNLAEYICVEKENTQEERDTLKLLKKYGINHPGLSWRAWLPSWFPGAPQEFKANQSHIFEPANALGYKIESGICYGETYSAIQSIQLSEREPLHSGHPRYLTNLVLFKKRLELLTLLRVETFIVRYNEVKEKVKKEVRRLTENGSSQKEIDAGVKLYISKLTLYERLMVDMPAFFERVMLYQNTFKYQYLLDDRTVKENRLQFAIAFHPLLTPVLQDEHGGVVELERFSSIYTEIEMTQMLGCLRNAFANATHPISFSVTVVGHVLSLHYDPVTGCWIYYDSDPLCIIDGGLKGDEEVAKLLFKGLSIKKDRAKPIACTFAAYSVFDKRFEAEACMATWKKLPRWQQIHTITPEKAVTKDRNNSILLDVVMHAYDWKTAQQIYKCTNILQRNPVNFPFTLGSLTLTAVLLAIIFTIGTMGTGALVIAGIAAFAACLAGGVTLGFVLRRELRIKAKVPYTKVIKTNEINKQKYEENILASTHAKIQRILPNDKQKRIIPSNEEADSILMIPYSRIKEHKVRLYFLEQILKPRTPVERKKILNSQSCEDLYQIAAALQAESSELQPFRNIHVTFQVLNLAQDLFLAHLQELKEDDCRQALAIRTDGELKSLGEHTGLSKNMGKLISTILQEREKMNKSFNNVV